MCLLGSLNNNTAICSATDICVCFKTHSPKHTHFFENMFDLLVLQKYVVHDI